MKLNGAEAIAAVEARNKELARILGGDASAVNVDRILRLPGTINLPTKAKRDKGRVRCQSHAIHLSYNTHSLDAFTPISEEKPRAENRGNGGAADLDDLIENGCGERFGGDRSRAVYYVVNELLRRGKSHDEIVAILTREGNGISESILEKPDPPGEARRQVEKAAKARAETFELGKDNRTPSRESQHNIRLALARLGVALAYDTFQDRLLIEGLKGFGPALDDAAVTRLWLTIDQTFGFRPSRELFQAVVEDEARLNQIHPVRDWLNSLKWDGVPRLADWLTTYGGAESTPYTRAVGSIMLIAAVRRVRQPGCKFDEMPVLESAQGKNKSSALALLAVQEEWFSDDLPLNSDAQKTIERTAGRWIIEAAELGGMRKGEVEHLKAFLSRGTDRARPAYGRLPKAAPRQFVIIGTTNNDRYLRDLTGNRRFWPVATPEFDLDALRGDRDQLWAEAAAREAKGETIRLDPSLWASAAEQQEERKIDDPWVSILEEAIGDFQGRLRAKDAWEIVKVPEGQRTQGHNERLGEALRFLGFERKKIRFPGEEKIKWGYQRGDGSEVFRGASM